MFDLRAVTLQLVVVICITTGVISSQPYHNWYTSQGRYAGNYWGFEGIVQRERRVSTGYAQPVANGNAYGYIAYPNHGSYKVHRYGGTWHHAMSVCASEGSSLVIVTSQAEANLIKTMFRLHEQNPGAVNNLHFWVGAQERGTHGEFYTIVGDRLEQSGHNVWSPLAGGQPNDPGPADCVSIFTDGTYFDDDCTSKYAFVCEKFVG